VSDFQKGSDHFVVEADRRVVGLAVRVPGGFKFFCSDTDFLSIDGQVFPRIGAINRRIAQINQARQVTPAVDRHLASLVA
jgi:hypothetical protein